MSDGHAFRGADGLRQDLRGQRVRQADGATRGAPQKLPLQVGRLHGVQPRDGAAHGACTRAHRPHHRRGRPCARRRGGERRRHRFARDRAAQGVHERPRKSGARDDHLDDQPARQARHRHQAARPPRPQDPVPLRPVRRGRRVGPPRAVPQAQAQDRDRAAARSRAGLGQDQEPVGQVDRRRPEARRSQQGASVRQAAGTVRPGQGHLGNQGNGDFRIGFHGCDRRTKTGAAAAYDDDVVLDDVHRSTYPLFNLVQLGIGSTYLTSS